MKANIVLKLGWPKVEGIVIMYTNAPDLNGFESWVWSSTINVAISFCKEWNILCLYMSREVY